MSNLVDYAEKELNILERGESEEAINKYMHNCIIDIVKAFSEQGHSGFSAEYAIQMLERLMRFEPLTPLTGEDDEWIDVSEASGVTMYQNKRCYRVFKGEDGVAYDIEGKVFVPSDGSGAYTGKGSRVDITFPYIPKTEFVEVDEH